MKAKWKDNEIKMLFDIVKNNNKKNIPTMYSFKEFSNITKRNIYSIRNFYYSYLKILRQNTNLASRLNICANDFNVQQFKHFDAPTTSALIKKIDALKQTGLSTRSACFKLCDGDIKQMLRYQNKYQNCKKNKKSATIYNFPAQNNQKTALSDDDIKSLFMGLVKLVKENASQDCKTKYQLFLEKTEEQKRLHLVEIEQKNIEIAKLNNHILKLKQQNLQLNQQLKDYRIELLTNSPPQPTANA